MSRAEKGGTLLAAFAGRQFKPTVILGVSTVTMITWKYFVSPAYYTEHLSHRFVWFGDVKTTAAVYCFVGALVLFGVVPALIVKFLFGESLAEYGLRMGDATRTVRSFLICGPAVAVIAYFAARDPSFWGEYPINKHAGWSHQAFALHAATYFLFYIGWEFQFRGFMQHGLKDSMGPTSALLVQTMASVVLHLGKPVGETYGSIVGALVWGLLAYRTRSIYSGLMQHFLLGILLDWFICHPW